MTDRTPRHAVVIASGGLDSTAVAYLLAAQGARVSLLSFDYGQRHSRELECAAQIAQQLGAAHEVVDLVSVGRLLRGSALTDDSIEVPDGHYNDVSMQATVVPNRNAIMLSIAVGAAVSAQADAVAFGAHAGDHTIYPDCRPGFFACMAETVRLGNEGLLADDFELLAPFLQASKADIVQAAAGLGVPFGLTWSCYKGGRVHCGTCGTCCERREAFALSGLADPTEYAEPCGVTR
ncbi:MULTISPECIES: 7-cyano-7-deazaguanine synthase QueC [Streptomyces]|uniref:7-cyano-7-deazaguanine synthase QueC n=1 Tax=Streptomyces TaxID=1883 RepID=UPI00163BA417|nr:MULTISPECIES: 7-cyano-7-deazaguanine synthase QueC [Streptomyces]MBC2879316.1 7-cyano-7-deazaguanine synthase QueC [Streptomyces sp. TYQ1024]UBI40084.1 7-cyano-7-deazaguanine synthase QueC [Streptomyces mobaraensis]UKW32663.1 7-cyano-7-deazaguanine synthase QueC [Streptomyces sp. TYQ1024]